MQCLGAGRSLRFRRPQWLSAAPLWVVALPTAADCCRLLLVLALCYGDCDCGSFAATCLAFLSPAHPSGLPAKISSSQLSG
jgi:hypothetical protein